MEKRLVIFLILSIVILTGHALVRSLLFPPQPQAANQQVAEKPGEKEAGQKQPAGKAGGEKENKSFKEPAEAEQPGQESKTKPEAKKPAAPGAQETEPQQPAEPAVAEQWVTLGSFDPTSDSRLLVTFDNRGASIERAELVGRDAGGRLRYRDLGKKYGYLGLRCRNTPNGCTVRVVGPGTPAATAKPDSGAIGTGFAVGDVIVNGNDTPLRDTDDLQAFLGSTKPKQSVTFKVLRAGQQVPIQLTTTLEHYPLELIEPEETADSAPIPSYLLSVHSIGNQKPTREGDLLDSFSILRTGTWKVSQPNPDEVVFTKRVSVPDSPDDELEFVKRFTLGGTPALGAETPEDYAAYHLQMEVQIRNVGSHPQTISYAMDGPNGLPLEGWWYTNKIHPSWGSAGARRDLAGAGKASQLAQRLTDL